MKSERRHELQTNALADRLGGTMLWIEENYKSVLGVIVATAVVVGVYMLLSRSSAAKVAQSWNEYYAAATVNNPDSMRTVADNYPKTLAGQWARLWLGDQYLQQGVDQLFQDRAQANDELRKAIAEYEAVLQLRVEPLLAQRANLGLARAHESLDQLEEARKIYTELADVKRWPDALFAAQAQARLDDLELPQTKAFYDWFAAQDPKPSLEGGIDKATIDSLRNLPDDPGSPESDAALFPENNEPAEGQPAKEPSTEAPAADPAAATEPAASTEPAAAPAPAENPPAETAPSNP